jgi:hypothetical protein
MKCVVFLRSAIALHLERLDHLQHESCSRKTARPLPDANYDAWPKVDEVAASILLLASPENRVTRGAVVSTFGRS